MRMRHSIFLVLIAALSGCAIAPESATAPAATTAVAATPPTAPAPMPAPSAFEKATVRDHIVIAGQPTLSDLKSLRERGIVHVFNVRSVEEMNPDTIGFDEVRELAALGIGYHNHPVAGGNAFTAELLAAFAEQVKASNGKILLHCASGGRAAQLYAAYAVKHLGLSVDAAMRTLEPFGGWPLPLERMLGEHLSVVRSSDVQHTGGRRASGNAVDSALGRSEYATCPQ